MVRKFTEEEMKIAVNEVRSREKSIRQAAADNEVSEKPDKETTLKSRLSSNNEVPIVGRP